MKYNELRDLLVSFRASEYTNVKDKKTFDAKIADLQNRIKEEGLTSSIDVEKLTAYNEMASAYDAIYWWSLYVKETMPEVDGVQEFIDRWEAKRKQFYNRKSSVEVARFYALAVHYGKLPSIETSRKKKATLRCISLALGLGPQSIYRDYNKASDMLQCEIYGSFEQAEKLLAYIPG